mgnify:FL=1
MSKAVVYNVTGGPEVLKIEEVGTPSPGAGEALIRVEAVGINPFDDKVRSGFIPSDASFPRRIGGDLAGTVLEVGADAAYWDGTTINVGDKVMGQARGSLAERVIAPSTGLTPRPSNLPVDVAGAMNVPALTALSCLATVPVGPGDTVLVGGATGAVGMVAAQLARQAGARVIGTAAERNFEFVRSLGVEPVKYGPGLAERVKELGDITVVMDCHGREALDAGVELGVPVDKMVAIAGYAAVQELGVHNVEREARTMKNLAKLATKVADGELVFPVVKVFPLDQVREAFEALNAPHAPGKIVVTP